MMINVSSMNYNILNIWQIAISRMFIVSDCDIYKLLSLCLSKAKLLKYFVWQIISASFCDDLEDCMRIQNVMINANILP